MSGWLSNPEGVWPWAEANQGSLTVLALVVALSVSVYELSRSARWQERELIQYIDYVLSAADRAIELTTDAVRTCDGTVSEIEQMPLPTWDFLQNNALQVLQEVASVKPSSPELVLLVNQLERVMSVTQGHVIFERGERDGLLQILFLLEVTRGKIALVKPPSLIERLCDALHLSKQKYPIASPISDGLRYSGTRPDPETSLGEV
jgi:hypothetical protein